MNVDDVFTWGAIAVVGGPIAAALAIPLLRWCFLDLRRLAGLLLLVVGLSYYFVYSSPSSKSRTTQSPTRSASPTGGRN